MAKTPPNSQASSNATSDALLLGMFLALLATDDDFRKKFNRDKRGTLDSFQDSAGNRLSTATKSAIARRSLISVFDALAQSNQNSGEAKKLIAARRALAATSRKAK